MISNSLISALILVLTERGSFNKTTEQDHVLLCTQVRKNLIDTGVRLFETLPSGSKVFNDNAIMNCHERAPQIINSIFNNHPSIVAIPEHIEMHVHTRADTECSNAMKILAHVQQSMSIPRASQKSMVVHLYAYLGLHHMHTDYQGMYEHTSGQWYPWMSASLKRNQTLTKKIGMRASSNSAG